MSGRLCRVVVAAALSVVVGGCHGPHRAAPQAPSADPVAGIESTVDAVERDVDTDSGADVGR